MIPLRRGWAAPRFRPPALLLLLLIGAGRTTAAPAGAAPSIALTVDAREAPRGLFHSQMTISGVSGRVTLVYPEWIPGEHGPTGPLVQLAGLRVEAGERPVPWTRDPVDLFAFHCEVPPGLSSLQVSLDYVSPPTSIDEKGYGTTPNATPRLAVVLWNQLLLYPSGSPASALSVTPTLILPAGWKWASALRARREDAGRIELPKTDLVSLIDSPVLAGRHLRTETLSAENAAAPVALHVAADGSEDLAIPAEFLAGCRRLVAQAEALFGAHHYRHYDFLVSASDFFSENGLEHHESSDDRVPSNAFTDEASRMRQATLLPHEYVHSWNGKYRRPAGLLASDYQAPMDGSLLWIYEGLTRYLGDLVLTSRSGLRNEADTRDYVAWVLASLENRRGRVWRSLEDTAVSARVLYGAPPEWASWRRGVDFYDESLPIWMEADAIIRSRSGGKRSLDDFCRRFHGPPSGPPQVRPYGLGDVLAALSEVEPYDWRRFFAERVERPTNHAPMSALEAVGWRLVFDDRPNAITRNREKTDRDVDFADSLGFWVRAEAGQEGMLRDVVPGSPADRSGLSPGMKLVAVNGRRYSAEGLREAVRSATTNPEPLELIVQNRDDVTVVRLDDHRGLRFPHLERIAGRPDLLADIIRAR